MRNEQIHVGEQNYENDQKERVLDLRNPVDFAVEREEKDHVMNKRDVYLEQVRAIDIIKRKFQTLLKDDEEFKIFCVFYDINNDLANDLKFALPSIVSGLERSADDIVKSKAGLEDYQQFLYNIMLKDSQKIITKNEYRNFLNECFEAEVKFAFRVLDYVRERPILSHRVRGFGKDESSKEALENALKENISELEFDIRKSKDNKIIIHHNVTLGASANKIQAIKDLEWEELKNVELKNGEHLTNLEDFFENINKLDNKVTKINIDIKDFDEKMLDDLLELIKKYNFEHRVNIVSWFPQALQYLYEKDPNLHYSMSYFPQVRGISKLLMSKIENNDLLNKLWGVLGTWFAKKREEAIKNGTAKIQGYNSEVISSTLILDANEHWQDLKNKSEKSSKDLVGVHEFPYGPIPIDEDYDINIMSRVLHNGSINIMAFEEMLSSYIKKIPILKNHKEKIINLFNRTSALKNLIKQCATNKVAVNLYDLKKEEDMNSYFELFEDLKKEQNVKYIKTGTIYSSNKDMISRLDTRLNV